VSGAERRFRYRLDSLIRLRSAERDALSGEAARAAREVQDRARECEELAQAVELAERMLRTLRRDGASISVDEELRLQSYLGLHRRQREAKQRELDQASRSMEKALAELQAKQRDARALESHRERQRRRFDEQAARVALNGADEQWLRKKGGG
jgi:flagellar biosynthesis chaperone FliJ